MSLFDAKTSSLPGKLSDYKPVDLNALTNVGWLWWSSLGTICDFYVGFDMNAALPTPILAIRCVNRGDHDAISRVYIGTTMFLNDFFPSDAGGKTTDRPLNPLGFAQMVDDGEGNPVPNCNMEFGYGPEGV